MKTIGVIPARWGSTRFEGKVLADLHGKPVVQHVWERARQSSTLDDIIIATDDERIAGAARTFQARVMMTSKDCASGTDRIAEAVRDIPADIVVNIQGDEPFIAPQLIDAVTQALIGHTECVAATAVNRIRDRKEIESPHVVKAVLSRDGQALYFSRSVIPFRRDDQSPPPHYFRHIGIYAYRREFLFEYQRLPSSLLEQAEKLEQLRILEAGYAMAAVETEYQSRGIDTPEDLREIINNRESEK